MTTRFLFKPLVVALFCILVLLVTVQHDTTGTTDTPAPLSPMERDALSSAPFTSRLNAASAVFAAEGNGVYVPIVQTSADPYPGAPLCPEEAHDSEAYHGLWNSDLGCHYDHTHNAPPFALNTIFGPVGQPYGGQTISYPWQTPGENEYKHTGYKWEYASLGSCLTNEPDDNCVTAFRLQFHVVGQFGANFRTHSFWLEGRVCDQTGQQCGTIKTGGWSDFGILCVPYKGDHVPLPGMDPPNPPTLANGEVDCEVPPYRGHVDHQVALERGKDISYTWNSSSRYGYNNIVEYDFQSRDDFGGINVNEPAELSFVCPGFRCDSNHSTMLVYEIIVDIPAALDTDGDGFVTYSGYSDRYGSVLDGDCSPLDIDCVPLEIENVPVGVASYRVPLRPDTPHNEYDVYFCGGTVCGPDDPGATPAGWIVHPN